MTIESNIGHRRRSEKYKRIMQETRFIEFPALYVDSRVGISRAYDIKYHSHHFFYFDVLRRITTLYERSSMFIRSAA